MSAARHVKVDLAALRKKGFGKDGTFVRTTSPAFTLRYPNEFQNQPLQPGQIFNAGTPGGSPSIGISIVPLQADADIQEQLQGFAAVYAGYLKPVGSDIKIVSNESIDEYKNFKAFRFEIVWRFQGQIPLTTVGDLIAKGNQAILVVGHTTYHIGELLDIFKTINLDP
ncbi:MAG: hypothetical protein GY866_35010 [Proteobacteria bacterium]|nr:hypothetical protein [Pseudomonadota bacterium]